MIKINGRTQVMGTNSAMRGMRLPYKKADDSDTDNWGLCLVGPKDKELAVKLIKAGPEHRKFLRMMHIHMEITAPLYWWKQMDTYKVGTTTNSESTMHTIAKKEFEASDFSVELCSDEVIHGPLQVVIDCLNYHRDNYLKTKNQASWNVLIQMLPSSYNQTRMWDADFETLLNIYSQRKGHKLTEWYEFCDWIEKIFKTFFNLNIAEL